MARAGHSARQTARPTEVGGRGPVMVDAPGVRASRWRAGIAPQGCTHSEASNHAVPHGEQGARKLRVRPASFGRPSCSDGRRPPTRSGKAYRDNRRDLRKAGRWYFMERCEGAITLYRSRRQSSLHVVVRGRMEVRTARRRGPERAAVGVSTIRTPAPCTGRRRATHARGVHAVPRH